MREILFRGKEKNSGEWIYGDLRHISDGHGGYILCIVDNTNGRNNDVTGVEVVPETVGQYTGLTDKNGVKIFEGDIVKGTAYSATRIGVIVWIDEISSFGVRYVNAPNPTAWENSSILRCVSLGKTDEFAAEVIGNIHDNPELLNAAANGRR
nr:MAG TPA: YopX protein [Caudoviricetes sp.]